MSEAAREVSEEDAEYISRLVELERQGLIEVGAGEIRLTERGGKDMASMGYEQDAVETGLRGVSSARESPLWQGIAHMRRRG